MYNDSRYCWCSSFRPVVTYVILQLKQLGFDFAQFLSQLLLVSVVRLWLGPKGWMFHLPDTALLEGGAGGPFIGQPPPGVEQN